MPHPPFTGDYAAILKKYWGHDTFRPLQLETIESVAAGRDTLVLMPTGGGKSVIYQVPALASEGVCIVITPLISLMKDQVDRLRSRRILAEAIHGGRGRQEIDRVLDNCIYGDVKFLYISPERVDSELFRMRFAKMKVSLIAVDEAHCISQWGYDFRPAYLQIARLRDLQPEAAILALTASATPKVAADIMQHLRFREPNLKQMSFARANLSYVVRRTEDKREHLLRIVNNVPGSGIVYVRTREKTETVAKFLQENGIEADSYHGGMGYLTRSLKQENWTGGKTRVIVATNAFGMGIDKADVRFVIHYDICDSLEAYYQEAGRAGRDGRPAYAVMLLSGDDPSRVANRLRLEFPPVDTIRTIYEGLFNYLQVAIGEGKHRAFAFNIHEFAARMKLFPPTVVNALKILQQNGYLILTDETDNPPRIRFIVQRDDLYRMRVTRRELDHILTVLLRQYTGLFSDFVPIDEQELALLSGYTVNHIHELLRQLWQLHVIRYIPGNRSPMLILSEAAAARSRRAHLARKLQTPPGSGAGTDRRRVPLCRKRDRVPQPGDTKLLRRTDRPPLRTLRHLPRTAQTHGTAKQCGTSRRNPQADRRTARGRPARPENARRRHPLRNRRVARRSGSHDRRRENNRREKRKTADKSVTFGAQCQNSRRA